MRRYARWDQRTWMGLLGILVALSGCGGEGGALPTARALDADSASVRDGVYSPDGSLMAYWTEQPDSNRLEVARADLSGTRTLATTVPGFSGPGTWAPDGRAVAFAKVSGGLADVWIAPVEGGTPRRLTDAPGIEVPHQWHPSGDRLAYIATVGGGTIRMDVLDTGTLTSRPMLPETRPAFGNWSPDGSAIAYVLLGGSGTTTLWLADSTGGNARQLTTEGFEDVGEATSPWSPDGSRLLYTSRRTGTRDVWVMPVAGGEPRQLTRDVREDYDPVWSPDGRWVAFLSDRGRQTDIWLVPADGGTEVRVTDDTDVEQALRWRPGANELKYEVLTQREALWARSVADGSERRLTPDPVRMAMFDMTRDGSQVVFPVIRGGGVMDLMTVPVAGGTPRTLVSTSSADGMDPRWSPDGSTVAFISNRAGSDDVWLVDAAGGDPRPLTTWPSREANPRWTPDGSAVYFLSDHENDALPDLWLVSATGGEPRRLTQSGRVLFAELIPHSSDLTLTVLGDRAGELTVQRLTPDGALHPLWERTNAFGGPVSPDGTSLAVYTVQPDGNDPTMLVSLVTGRARQILGSGEGPLDWSPDGSRLLYRLGGQVPDLAILTLADSTVERVTSTPDRREWGAKWTPDGETIVIAGGTSQNRMFAVDVGTLIGR
jgi:Tol biopolymer transport system component